MLNNTQNVVKYTIKHWIFATKDIFLVQIQDGPFFYFGGVAHLARAFEWHSKGSRFKSDHLHKVSDY